MTDFIGGADDEAFVVNAGKGFAGDFADFEKMVKIGGGEILAKVAITIRIDWLEELAEAGIFDINATMRRIEGAVTGLAGWSNTVESITAIFGADEKIARLGAHTKEMARFVLRNDFVGKFDDIGSFVGFGGVKRANTVAINRLSCHEFGGFTA